MITPSFGLTATERVLPRLALDWTTGLAQSGVDVTRAGVATFVGSDGLIQSATADTQRIDYSTGVPGLLVEESRINLVTYSEDFANAAWSKTGASITSNTITAPDGALTGDKLVEDTSTGFHLTQSASVSVTSGNAYTLTVFAKKAERSQMRLGLSATQFASGRQALFDLDNGTAAFVEPGVTASVKNIGNGWYRFAITATATSTGSGPVTIQLGNNATNFAPQSYTGNGTSGIYIWGAQLEAGAFPTSYIPTEATAVTRNADVATMTGTNFSDWFNASEGTFEVDTLTNDTSSTSNPYALVVLGDGNNRITMQYATSARFLSWVRLAGVASISTINTVARNVRHNATYAYKTSDSGGAIDGNATVLSSPQPTGIPAVTFMTLGHYSVGGPNAFLNGYMRKLMYWPQRLTDAEVQAFSK